MSDSAAFHEVDEAVRKDELKEWWGRWGTWVVAGAVVVVVGVTALVGWRQYDASRRAEASAAYSAALAQIAQDKPAALKAFEDQAKNAPEPYRALAALVAAQLREPLEAQVTALLDSGADPVVRRACRPRQRDRRLQEHRFTQGRGDGRQARAAGRSRPAVPAERARAAGDAGGRARATSSAPANCGARSPRIRRRRRPPPSAPRRCLISTDRQRRSNSDAKRVACRGLVPHRPCRPPARRVAVRLRHGQRLVRQQQDTAGGRARSGVLRKERARARQGDGERAGRAAGAVSQRFLAAVRRLRQLRHAQSRGQRFAADHLDGRRRRRLELLAHPDDAADRGRRQGVRQGRAGHGLRLQRRHRPARLARHAEAREGARQRRVRRRAGLLRRQAVRDHGLCRRLFARSQRRQGSLDVDRERAGARRAAGLRRPRVRHQHRQQAAGAGGGRRLRALAVHRPDRRARALSAATARRAPPTTSWRPSARASWSGCASTTAGRYGTRP